MVSATFSNGRSKPKPGVDEAECQALAETLVALILSGSNIIDTFRELTRHSAEYGDYLPAITNIIQGDLAGAAGDLKKDLEFYQSLEIAHQGYALKPDVWVDALGLIVEFTFLILMRRKYVGARVSLYHEHMTLVSSGSDNMNTAPKPIDVIAWCSSANCGEFLEVKKDLDKRIRYVKANNAKKLVEKVEKMYDLLAFLDTHSAAVSVVGLATLSRNPLASRLVELTLRKAGKLGATAPLSSLPHQLQVITSADLIEWYTKKVI